MGENKLKIVKMDVDEKSKNSEASFGN